MTELQILSAIKNNGGSIEFTALLNQNMTDANRDSLADQERIKQMIKNGLLSGKTDAYCHISITKPGRLHLQNATYLEEQNKKRETVDAESKSEQKRQNRFLRITTLVSLGIAAITTLIALVGLFVK